MPLFSIIIPTYNRKTTIIRAIRSILEQRFLDFEIIVVDDGSIDNTKKEIENFLSEKLIYIFQVNSGVSSARNLGASKASGKYLIFLDSDDILLENALSIWYSMHQKNHNGDIYFTSHINIGSDGSEIIVYPKKNGILFNNLVGSFNPGSFILRKDIFNLVNGYDINLKFSENYDLGLRIVGETGPNLITYYSDLCTSKVFIQKNISLRSDIKNKIDAVQLFIHKHENLLCKKNYMGKYLNILAYLFVLNKDYQRAFFYYRKACKHNKWHLRFYFLVGKSILLMLTNNNIYGKKNQNSNKIH